MHSFVRCSYVIVCCSVHMLLQSLVKFLENCEDNCEAVILVHVVVSDLTSVDVCCTIHDRWLGVLISVVLDISVVVGYHTLTR